MLASMLPLSDLIFSGGGDTDGGTDDEGSAVANLAMHSQQMVMVGSIKQTHQSQMPLYPQLEGTGSSIGIAEESAGARCSSSSLSSSSSSTSSSSSSSLDNSSSSSSSSPSSAG
ncbi:hypothetical protein Tco_0588222 [Tanacetum coccineum]